MSSEPPIHDTAHAEPFGVRGTKLRAPLSGRAAVTRAGLIAAARAGDARVVSVSAPAGYGKSTLLGEWAQGEDREVVWATLDRFDDDPAALLGVMAAALEKVAPDDGLLASIVAMPKTGAAVLGRAAPMLASMLERIETPFVFLLDDVHETASPACQDVFEIVFSHVPEGSQAIIASRSEPPFIARLRIDGSVSEHGASDLRIDAEGAKRIFEAMDAAHVDDDQVRRVVERTEGWPTGIALAALVSRDGGDLGELSGDDRFVADYLYEACYRGLSERDREFLRRTAVLEQISSGACDAVLESHDAQARLFDLEARNLFLVPLDRVRGWYRYHPLFREFLLAELRRVDAPIIGALHRRAASWYEAHDFRHLAIEHLLASGDRERSARMVAQQSLAAYQAGELAAVGRWMRELGDEAIAAFPSLVVLACMRAVLAGEAAEAEKWGDLLETLEDDRPPELDLPAFESSRAMLRVVMWRNGLAACASDALFAVGEEQVPSLWRDQALHLFGWTRLLSGDTAGAIDSFEESSRLAAAVGNPDSVILSEAELAILALDRGASEDAERHIASALDTIDVHRMAGYATTALALAVAARAALQRGDSAEADRQFTRAMRERGSCTRVMPVFAVKVRLELARTSLARGDIATGFHLLDEIEELLAVQGDLGSLLDDVAAVRRRLGEYREMFGDAPLTPAELRLLPYLQTHLTIGEIGGRLFISRNTVSSEVGSIYRKLQVTTRGGAVERARELGLLASL